MSTIRFTKDHGEHKAKAVASVPFVKAREYVARGVAEDVTLPAGAKAPANVAGTGAADRHAAEIVRLNDAHRAALGEVRAEAEAAAKAASDAHAAAVKRLTAELDAAKATITDLQAKLGAKK